MTGPTPRLLLGPILRYVDHSTATIWVETDREATVRVDLAAPGGAQVRATARTWGVRGHHYALVVVRDLRPDSTYSYQVRLDDEQVWPAARPAGRPPAAGELDSYPASLVRTMPEPGHAGAGGLRIAFGSCRRAAPFDAETVDAVGADALVALAHRMAGSPPAEWPHVLFLVGDQIYADEPSAQLRERLADRHRHGAARAAGEIGDFEEYTWLYHEAWSPPSLRWLLSTVSTCMMLDDHDLRDDWNTSQAWRQEVTALPWWRDRVLGAFSSYWVYQHLGNLSPEQIAEDRQFHLVTEAADDAERGRLLDELAWRAGTQPHGVRWSFSRRLGRVHLVAVDSRCARQLRPGRRRMVEPGEWQWVREQVLSGGRDGDVDHLLVGTTLPAFLLPGIHHLETWDEAVADGAWGSRWAQRGERIRRALDLEHWAAFQTSFRDLARLLQEVVGGGSPPASILLLSGDVHCSYTARVDVGSGGPQPTAVHQLVMSPFRNPLGTATRWGFRALGHRRVANAVARLARAAGVGAPPAAWRVENGPWFDNGVTTVHLQGRQAVMHAEHARVSDGEQVLRRTATLRLTEAPGEPGPGARSTGR